MRIAVFTSKFPARVNTFFSRDMRGLIDAGCKIDVYSIYPEYPENWRYIPGILSREDLSRDNIRHTRRRAILGKAVRNIAATFGLRHDVTEILSESLQSDRTSFFKSMYVVPWALEWARKAETSHPYDYVFAYWGNYAATCAYLFHRALGQPIPFSFFLHAGTDLYRNDIFMRQKLLYADDVFTNSTFNVAFMQERYSDIFDQIRPKLHMHKHGLDLNALSCTNDRPHRNRIIAVGGFFEEKGFSYLLHAVHLLARRKCKVELVLVGHGPLLSQYRSIVRSLGLGAVVRFTGWLQFEEVEQQMRTANILVHPSSTIGDGVPTVIKEAMAIGTPVIATRVAGIPELLGDGERGLLVEPANAKVLADAIEELLDDDELQQRFRVRARCYVEDELDYRRNGAEMAAIMRASRRRGGIQELEKTHLPRNGYGAPPSVGQGRRPERGILLVGNFLSQRPGTHSIAEELGARLAKVGWTVVTSSNVANRPVRLTDMLSTVWMKRERYDLAHVDVFSDKAFIWAEAVCWMLRRADKPYVLTLRGGSLPEFALRWPDRMRRLLRSAHVVTTPSSYLYEHMEPYADALRLVPNPIDLASYKFTLRRSATPKLVWLRSFHHVYNPELAPRVLAHLNDDYPSCRLLMVGPDKGEGTLRSVRDEISNLGIQHKVELPGGVPKKDVPRWLSKGDIFLNTTNVDNAPVSVLEAMACGLCVVSTNVGGIPYLLEDGRDALLVPPGDEKAMADAVRSILKDPKIATDLSRNGRIKAEQLAWSKVFPEWTRLFEGVLDHA